MANSTSGPRTSATVSGCCGLIGFQASGKGEIEFDAIAILPFAIECGEAFLNRRRGGWPLTLMP